MSHFNLPPDLARAISDLTNRLSTLERTPSVIVGSGPPSSVPPGTLYLDKLNDKLWAPTSAGLRSVALT